MRSSAVFVSLLQLSVAFASILIPRQYESDSREDIVERLCFPMNSTGGYNLDAPCNKVFDVEARCVYGGAYDMGSEDVEGDMPHSSAADQKDCICKTQFWDYVDG
jgi:hypothetical protein